MMRLILSILIAMFSFVSKGADLQKNDLAPEFSLKNQEGKDFNLSSRKGEWTILYFYPKADTPGCTKQACAFRDSIKKIHAHGAEVYGVSADTVAEQAASHKKHHLNFDLLADFDSKVIGLYGTKMSVGTLSNRWTFVIDPELKIKMVLKDVDPVADSEKMAVHIAGLKAAKKK